MSGMGRPMTDHSAILNPEEARLAALTLMKKKDELEKELSELHAGLQAINAELGISLIDNEGFPRGDIDIYSVRTTRIRVIELHNDLKSISEQVKSLLEVALARQEPSKRPNRNEEELASTPFALVNGVAPGSPAASAVSKPSTLQQAEVAQLILQFSLTMQGLARGDKLVRFGSINSENHEGLRAVATEVSKNENRTVTIAILRKEAGSEAERRVDLVLVPKTWSGRGLLGCHIVPV